MKAWKHVIFTHVSDFDQASSSDFGHLQPSAAWVHMDVDLQHKGKPRNKTVKPWPIFNWVHGSLFHMESSASKAHSSYFDSLFTPTPTTPSSNPADGGSFVHEHPGNNFKGCNAGCKCGVAKNKTKLKNREAPEGTGDIHSSTLKRGKREKSYCVPLKQERKTERKRELA